MKDDEITMATIKSFTSLEQSKKLTEILPLESADMSWQQIYDENHMMSDYRVELIPYRLYSGIGIPCWSLAALLDVMPEEITYETENLDEWEDYKFFFLKENGEYYIGYEGYNDKQDFISVSCTDLVDACYELILKLNELNLL